MDSQKGYPNFPMPIKLENVSISVDLASVIDCCYMLTPTSKISNNCFHWCMLIPQPEPSEEDVHKIKASFYSSMPLLPFSAFNGIPNMDTKPNIDPENPHCKRKSHPLEKCPICKRYFRRIQTHLQKHADQNMELTALTCKFCYKQFSNLGNLQIHLRTHTNTKPYVCEVCAKAFTQSCNLTNHKRIHTGERPFKCPHCERSFTQSGNLSNHIRLHLDLKPFKCHFCDKSFTQSGNLTSHLKNNHPGGEWDLNLTVIYLKNL